MKIYGFGFFVLLSLLLVATGAMAAITIEKPSSRQEICGLTGFNVSVANITTGNDWEVLSCYVGSTLVINVTNTSVTNNITLPDASTTTWVTTPSDVEGGTLNCTANNEIGLVGTYAGYLDESTTLTISIDNTAPTFTFTKSLTEPIGDGESQVITATSTDLLASRGFTFNSLGRETTLASDSYSFTYTVNADDYADGLLEYTATGVDNSSCSNSRTSAVQYVEVDHKGAVIPQVQGKAIAEKVSKAAGLGNIIMLLMAVAAVYLVFKKN